MKTTFVLLSALIFISASAFAQDAFFLGANKPFINLNPSFAGSNGGIRDQAFYQLDGFRPGAYVTYGNNFDAYIKRLKAGLALSYLQDDQNGGRMKTRTVGFTYAQHLNIKAVKIIPSLQVNYFQKQADVSSLTYGDMLDPRFNLIYNGFGNSIYGGGIISKEKSALVFNSGLLLNYKNLYAGVSVFNINQPDIGLAGARKLPARFSANLSYAHVSEQTVINLSVNASRQGSFNLVQFGANTVFCRHVIFGLNFMFNNFMPVSFTDNSAATRIDLSYTNMPSYNNAETLSFGYRNNFMSLTANYVVMGYNASINARGLYAVASYNLRNKAQRRQLTDFEAW